MDALVELSDEHVLQSVGIYRYHHPLESAAAYKVRLKALTERISHIIKSGLAIHVSSLFTFDNSLSKGRRMTRDLGRLMLRAYNAEADNCLRTLRAGNVVTARRRLAKSRDAIAKLGQMMEMRISNDFHALRIEELELTADFLIKRQEEREEAREHRAQLREEKRVQEELKAKRAKLEKEQQHYLNAIAALQAKGEDDSALHEKLGEIDAAIAQNDYRAANIRAGYVYVISNRGAFGTGIVKIGLTRRLEPMQRVYELGGASVPFRFDVHTLYFSNDAVTLETELHHHFTDRRLNHANRRREFFFATPADVREVLESKVGNLIEYSEISDATEYFQSLRYWPEDCQPEGLAARVPFSD